MEKNFFWQDKSGRGFNNNLNEENLIAALRIGEQEDTSYDDQPISEWAEEAEVGDVWENNTNKVTRTL